MSRFFPTAPVEPLRRFFGTRDFSAKAQHQRDALLERRWRAKVWLNTRQRVIERALAEQMKEEG
jgi:hypothetical protein